MRDAIGSFFSKHPDLDLPLTIDCLDMKEATPIGESGQMRLRTRLFHVEIKADENGSPTWDETAYPESFSGGIVLFLASKGKDCEELNLDLTVPGSAAEGEQAATAV
jgi:hypothetical protein